MIAHPNSGELCFHDERVQNESQRKNCHHQMHDVHNHIDCEQTAHPPATKTIVAQNQKHENYRNICVSAYPAQQSPTDFTILTILDGLCIIHKVPHYVIS